MNFATLVNRQGIFIDFCEPINYFRVKTHGVKNSTFLAPNVTVYALLWLKSKLTNMMKFSTRV